MQYKYMITKEKCKMTGPKAPKDPTRKRQGFYIMRNKEISGSVQPDGSGVQFIYLNDGRMISSAGPALDGGGISEAGAQHRRQCGDGQCGQKDSV